MERRELERAIRSIRKQVEELGHIAIRSHQIVEEWNELEPAFEGQGLAQIDEFFRLADALTWVWASHPQGSALRGELTSNTFRDVLDRNILLSETNNSQPGEEK